MIEKGKTYKIKGNSEYFKKKYGTSNPEFHTDCLDTEAWPGSNWVQKAFQGNWAAKLFMARMNEERGEIPSRDVQVWYGHVHNMGECVTEDELEELS